MRDQAFSRPAVARMGMIGTVGRLVGHFYIHNGNSDSGAIADFTQSELGRTRTPRTQIMATSRPAAGSGIARTIRVSAVPKTRWPP